MSLLGSSVLPAHVIVGVRTVQLGDVVRRAVQSLALSNEDWNALDEPERDMLLVATVHLMRDEAASERGYDA